MVREATQLVIGKGEVYFDQFVAGTKVGKGELYFGNTPSFTVSRGVTSLQQYVSYQGQKVEVEGVETLDTQSLSFTTDNISIENMAAAYGVAIDATAQASGGPITESFVAKKDGWYQLGMSQRPPGLRSVTGVLVKKAAVTIALLNNYEVDAALGRVHVLIDAVAIAADDTIDITFSWSGVARSVVISGRRNLFGSMRFLSNAPKGPKYNWFFPFVRLKGAGSIDLKSDEWQQIGFTADVFKRDPATEYTYMEKIP